MRIRPPTGLLTLAALTLFACGSGAPEPHSATPSPHAAPALASAAALAEADGGPPAAGDAGAEAFDEAKEVRTIALAGAPPVTIRLLGSALFEVTLGEREKDPGTWATIEIERRLVGGPGTAPERDAFEKSKLEPKKPGDGSERGRRKVHSASPGATYAYRARSSGDWSKEVILRAPVPASPPPAPKSVTAKALGPYAVRIAWEAGVQGTAGFEVETKVNGKLVRAALLDPTTRAFEAHLLLPGQHVEYRIVAFNAAGASAPSAEASLTTPERAAAGRGRAAALGPCVRTPLVAPKSNGGCNPEIDPIGDANGHPLFNVPGAGESCTRHFVGDYHGCTRDLGAFSLQADVVVVPGVTDEGFPLLHAVAGAGEYAGAQIQTIRFSRGHYEVVDEAFLCGEPYPDWSPLVHGVVSDDLAKATPPFEECQRTPFEL